MADIIRLHLLSLIKTIIQLQSKCFILKNCNQVLSGDDRERVARTSREGCQSNPLHPPSPSQGGSQRGMWASSPKWNGCLTAHWVRGKISGSGEIGGCPQFLSSKISLHTGFLDIRGSSEWSGFSLPLGGGVGKPLGPSRIPREGAWAHWGADRGSRSQARVIFASCSCHFLKYETVHARSLF